MNQFFQSCGLLVFWLGLQLPNTAILATPVTNTAIAQNQLQQHQSLCPVNLAAAIETVIKRPEFQRSQWGILVQTLASGKTLYQFQSDKYFTPASTTKLLTSAAVLQRFGSEFRFHTPVYATGTVPNLQTLRIVGKGDPSLTTEKLQKLVNQLKQQGVRQIKTLIVDDSYFKNVPINQTWEWGDLAFDYATPVSSLILNENSVTLKVIPETVGKPLRLEWSDAIAAKQLQVNNRAIAAAKATPYSIEIVRKLGQPTLEISGKLAIESPPDTFGIAVTEPGEYVLETLKNLLAEAGIIVGEGTVVNQSLKIAAEKEVAFIESETLAELLKKVNQDSNNLYAESMGNILTVESQINTPSEALEKQLSVLGVARETYKLVDSSGLSRQNLISPVALVQTLRLMTKTPFAQSYRDSLAIAGTNGTLQKRFQNTSVSGKLQAKTGTLTGVYTLAGYLQNVNLEPLVFSIMVNQADLPATEVRKAIDEIVLLLSSNNAFSLSNRTDCSSNRRSSHQFSH